MTESHCVVLGRIFAATATATATRFICVTHTQTDTQTDNTLVLLQLTLISNYIYLFNCKRFVSSLEAINLLPLPLTEWVSGALSPGVKWPQWQAEL